MSDPPSLSIPLTGPRGTAAPQWRTRPSIRRYRGVLSCWFLAPSFPLDPSVEITGASASGFHFEVAALLCGCHHILWAITK